MPVPLPFNADDRPAAGSRLFFKKAHKLHDYAQRARTGYPRSSARDRSHGREVKESQALYRPLCEVIPDAGHRAALLEVEPENRASLAERPGLVLLRAHRTRLRRLLPRANCPPSAAINALGRRVTPTSGYTAALQS